MYSAPWFSVFTAGLFLHLLTPSLKCQRAHSWHQCKMLGESPHGVVARKCPPGTPSTKLRNTRTQEAESYGDPILHPEVSTGGMPGASTQDPTHDKVTRRDPTGKADQDSRDSLDRLKHLPRYQNLSVYCLLYYAFHQLFWH